MLKRRLSTILNGSAAAPLTAPESELRPHSFTLLWLGRLSEPKDPFTLLRAWAEVRRTVPDCPLLVAGDGELRAPSEMLARQLGIEANVSFLGMRRDVGALLAASDAFVLSSKMEGLPISMIEAMAAGVPCIGTDAGGVRELIGDADCGAVTPVGDAAALASAIAACAGDAALRERWGQSARRHYLDRFTPQAMAERYLALYRELGRL